MTLPVDRHVDVRVTGNELIGVESDEPLRVLRMRETDNDDDDCAKEFEVVEPFQPQSVIQSFTSGLRDGRNTRQSTAVWLTIAVNLLKSAKLSVDEIDLLDSQLVDEEDSLELLGVNYTVVRLTLSPGFHVVTAVKGAAPPQLDLFQYIHVPRVRSLPVSVCVVRAICGRPDRVAATTSSREFPPRTSLNWSPPLIDSYSSNDLVLVLGVSFATKLSLSVVRKIQTVVYSLIPILRTTRPGNGGTCRSRRQELATVPSTNAAV